MNNFYWSEVANEVRVWRDAGLISPFDQGSLYDEVFANILTCIREHIEIGQDKNQQILDRLKREAHRRRELESEVMDWQRATGRRKP